MPTNIITSRDKIIWFLTFTFYTTLFFIGRNVYGSYYLAFIAGVILVFTGLKLQIHAFHVAVFQFALFCLLTIFWARNYFFAMEKANTLFKIFICMTVLYSYYHKRPDIDVILKTVLWSGYKVSFYAIIHYGPSRVLFNSARLYNEFLNVNSLGMLSSLTIIIHLYYIHFFKKYRDWFFLMIPLVFLIGSTQSRKAIIMLVVGYMFLIIFKNTDNIKKNLLPILRILFVAFMVVLVLVLLSQTDVFHGATTRMNDLIASFTGGESHSTNLRKVYRELGWHQLQLTPLLGIGMGNGRLLALEATNHDCYLHCNYAEIAACGGVIGLISYYGIYLYILVKEYKYLSVDKYAVIVVTIIFCKLLTDWGAVEYASKSTYYLFMMYFIHLEQCKAKYPYIK